jgi:hypothetical protein
MSGKPESTKAPLFQEYQPPPVWLRVWNILKWIEVVVTVGTLGATMWQVILLDRSMIFEAVCWSLPLPLCAYGALRPRSRPLGRSLATAYLLVTTLGMWIARTPQILPALGQFGDNQVMRQLAQGLPFVSRRILEWMIFADSFFLLIFLGYFVCYSPLRARREGRPHGLSPVVCYFGLAVLWGVTALALFGLLMAAILGS